MPATYYHVAPRYTAGSPAQVDRPTAEQVAQQEAASYDRHVQGLYGDDEMMRAHRLWLVGIAYGTTEHRGGIYVDDLITKGRYFVPGRYWGTQAPDGQRHWYSRTDREQFLVDPETGLTNYERRGRSYTPGPSIDANTGAQG